MTGAQKSAGSSTARVAAPRRTCLQKQLRKTKLCTYYSKGICQFGDECAFAHDSEELESAPDLTKTRLCKAFAKGNCNKEDCTFAHGEDELRSTAMFYKKTLCFWNSKGKCRSGTSCRFAHSLEELHANQAAAAAAATCPAASTVSTSDGNCSESIGFDGSDSGSSSMQSARKERKNKGNKNTGSDGSKPDSAKSTPKADDLASSMPMKIQTSTLEAMMAGSAYGHGSPSAFAAASQDPMDLAQAFAGEGQQKRQLQQQQQQQQLLQAYMAQQQMQQQQLLQQSAIADLLAQTNAVGPSGACAPSRDVQNMLDTLKNNIHTLTEQWQVLQQAVLAQNVQDARTAPATAYMQPQDLSAPLFPDYSPLNEEHQASMIPPPGLSGHTRFQQASRMEPSKLDALLMSLASEYGESGVGA
mmetsp:Transcript_70481/g.168794  ORF Transcript_70481/g.168794 Transcript_70481/m.168794 type:complete len:415 (-) Transcript_70481:219-1463(-)|eukprot:CAMPEP_0178418532 /NCGR_PEP_ID=MMETSP0689_2-20121128/25136_1 /TAXON_ID=160604 /ORGANISM="Amphidinium massartii, Strain CS-259" /LENGTH=414 /DNA_ID=CAMNT_0020039927 /DNA_START=171 /DNA_END=1415 /DNA_ORIENTATION=-